MTIMPTPQTKKELSHARIVEVASRAIRRTGYRGVGVADIMKEAGLTHGGFYAHFPSRDAMLVEAMQHAGHSNMAALEQGIQRRLRKGGTRLSALIETYLHESHIEKTAEGCIVAALASEMPREGDGLRHEARHRVAAMVALVKSALPEGADPLEAQLVTATMVGALQLARTIGGQAGRALLAQSRQALIERHVLRTRH